MGSLLSTLSQPRWWVFALAGFLVRGGILVMLLPIVILPTPSGVTNAFGPAVTGLALGGAGADLIALIVAIVAALVAALLIGAWVGALLEVALVREVVAEEEDGVRASAGGPAAVSSRPTLAGRGAVVHLLAHLPLVIVLAWGIPGVIEAGYAELILPQEMVTPLVARIVGRVPLIVGLIVGTWLLGEVIGGLALRQLVLGRSVPRSLFAAVSLIARRPLGASRILLSTQVTVLLLAIPALVAAGSAWDRVRILLSDGIATTGEAIGLAFAMFVFVALWLGGFVLVGLGTAVRATAWTSWSIAATPARDPGWPRVAESGTL